MAANAAADRGNVEGPGKSDKSTDAISKPVAIDTCDGNNPMDMEAGIFLSTDHTRNLQSDHSGILIPISDQLEQGF